MNPHSTKTDNFRIEDKIFLRKQGTKHLQSLFVLDLFAGENRLWKDFKKQRYYGVELVKGKGKNLNANNLKVIPSLDLSKFNVIDVDSYGIPFQQITSLYKNPTLQNGTVIFFTCISNQMSSLSRECLKMFGIQKMYQKVKVVFNKNAFDYFYGMLYNLGVRKVYKYVVDTGSFRKEYGYFIVDKTG